MRRVTMSAGAEAEGSTMANQDLYEDGGFDPFANFPEEGDSADSGSVEVAAGSRSLAEFEAEIDQNIAIVLSNKSPAKQRAEAARWLGESGETKAISPLVQVFKEDKSGKVRKAARYALGQFKALDRAIERRPDQLIEDALFQPENRDVLDLLTGVALNDQRGKRPGSRGLLLGTGILAIILSLLIMLVIYLPPGQLVPLLDSLRAQTVLTQPAGGENPLNASTPDAQPTEILETATPEPTITPLPTATPGIPPADFSRIMNELYILVDSATTPRSYVEGLADAWNTVQTNPGAIAQLCDQPAPIIPGEYVLLPEYRALTPTVGVATDLVNAGLGLARDGWARFRAGCVAGDLPGRVGGGIASVTGMRDAFSVARTQLDAIPR